MDPALIQSIIGMGQDPEAQELLRKQKMIDALRMNAMRVHPAAEKVGRVATPNFAGPIGNVMQAYMAQNMQGDVDQRQKAVSERQNAAQSKYLDALVMALRRQIPGTGSRMLPPDGMEDR